MYFMNPTGKKIRHDARGAGHYGARRTKIVAGKTVVYRHDGTDYEAEPGQVVIAPFTGIIEREARPYAGYSGLVLAGTRARAKLFYVKPDPELMGKSVKLGHRLGLAQDISKKYPGMTPHVHFRITSLDPEMLISDTPVY